MVGTLSTSSSRAYQHPRPGHAARSLELALDPLEALLKLALGTLIVLAWPLMASAEPQGSGDDEVDVGAAVVAPGEGASAAIVGGKRMTAAKTPAPPRIDGLLDEDEWRLAEVVSDFLQREPGSGQPASERTEVRILFDDENLYLGFILYDSRPDQIAASDLQRDSRMRADDSIEFILDTFHDRRNGFIFRVNPLGTKYDALLRNEDEVNADWDEQWEAAAHVTQRGWQVEIAIPWKALRFRTGSNVWGIDFQRVLRRQNEEMAWSNYRRGFSFKNISQGGDLLGLTDLRLTNRFRLKPYVSGGVAQFNQTDAPFNDRTGEIGVEDFKVRITPNLTADLTLNTDFAQVEDDAERVNLTRFSLFFPEKREFFLESADNFAFGSGGRAVNLFHSRNIGLVDGESVPITYGAKVTGKVGGTNMGVMNVQTGDSEFGAGENFTAIRLKQDLFERSSIGGIFTNVQRDGGFNRVMGLDGNFRFLDHLRFGGYFARADDSVIAGNPYVGSVRGGWDSDLWEVSGSYLVVEPGFDSGLGFIRRTDIEQQSYRVAWKPRPEGWQAVRQLRFSASVDYLTDTQGRLLTREAGITSSISFESGDSITFNYDQNFDRLDESFSISDDVTIPAGDYSFDTFWVSFRSFSARKVSGRVSISGGGYFNGTRYSVRPSGTVRFSEKLSISPSYDYNTVTVRGGEFESHTFGLRTTYNFSDQWLTTAFVQYNSVSGRMSVFARLNYVYRDGFDNVFLVYKQTRMFEGVYDGREDRQLLAKMTYSFDF
jgi:hypothetical protein